MKSSQIVHPPHDKTMLLSTSSTTSPSSSSTSCPTYKSLSHSSSTMASPIASSSSVWRRILVAFLVTFVLSSSFSEACFIRNCPKGGKRSLQPMEVAQRQCMRCGPGNQGQCVGPNICCSPQFGCHMNTPETEICAKENESLSPCQVTGDVCGSRDSGVCVANGICCDSDSCAFDDQCSIGRERKKLLSLLQKLLSQTKNYD